MRCGVRENRELCQIQALCFRRFPVFAVFAFSRFSRFRVACPRITGGRDTRFVCTVEPRGGGGSIRLI